MGILNVSRDHKATHHLSCRAGETRKLIWPPRALESDEKPESEKLAWVVFDQPPCWLRVTAWGLWKGWRPSASE